MANVKYFLGTGRRKTSVARVFLKEKGKGAFVVNDKMLDNYFGRAVDRKITLQPLALLGLEGKFDVMVNVCGGGLSGQSGAIRHGLTRALIEYNADWKPQLRAAGYVTRDSRIVERKKVGLHKARKALQYSKR